MAILREARTLRATSAFAVTNFLGAIGLTAMIARRSKFAIYREASGLQRRDLP